VRVAIGESTCNKKDQQTGSPCSHLPSLFKEYFRQCSSSLEKIEKSETLAKLFPEPTVVAFRSLYPVSSNDGVNLLVFALWFQQWSIFVLP
jgi:hypothetical protein